MSGNNHRKKNGIDASCLVRIEFHSPDFLKGCLEELTRIAAGFGGVSDAPTISPTDRGFVNARFVNRICANSYYSRVFNTYTDHVKNGELIGGEVPRSAY